MTNNKQIDSPFYLHRPHDLDAFLRQNQYLQSIIMLNAKILLINTKMVNKMEQCNLYTIDFMLQSECIINYFMQESHLYSTIESKRYLSRIIVSKKFNKLMVEANEKLNRRSNAIAGGGGGGGGSSPSTITITVPICEDVAFSMACMEHLDSMHRSRSRLSMQPELTLMAKELGLLSGNGGIHYMGEHLAQGIRNEPNSWRFHTLASYYWRAKGNAVRALVCARRALALVPRKHKDIPLLSIGTIFQRANRSADAVVVLAAAVDHAPTVAENHFALANALFMSSQFNESMASYRRSRELDATYAERVQFVRKSMACFKVIKIKFGQIERHLADMKADLANLMDSKDQQHPYFEKLLREQVPIATRLQDPAFENYSNYLLNRGQYCAVRKIPESPEPVLVCDFYSDFQSQMLSDVNIDTMQNVFMPKMGFIKDQWNRSLGVYKYLSIENYDGDEVNGGGAASDVMAALTTTTTTTDNIAENG